MGIVPDQSGLLRSELCLPWQGGSHLLSSRCLPYAQSVWERSCTGECLVPRVTDRPCSCSLFASLLRKPKARESLYSSGNNSRAGSQRPACLANIWGALNFSGSSGWFMKEMWERIRALYPLVFFYLRDLCRLNLCHTQSTKIPSHFTPEWRVQGCGIEPEMLTPSWLFALWCVLLVFGRKNTRTRGRNSQSCLGNRAQQGNGGRRRSTIWWLCVCFYTQG